MRTFLLSVLMTVVAATAGGAQAPAPRTPAQGPLMTFLRGMFVNNRNYIARAAESMPEEHYGMRPGPQTEVRTFGQLVGHLANYNYLWCSQAKGEKNPGDGTDFEKTTSKAALVKAINEALTYCDGVYTTLTDAAGLEPVTLTQENGRSSQSLRMNLLVLNYGHNNEHYGNMVTYMRSKSLVPPSSAPR